MKNSLDKFGKSQFNYQMQSFLPAFNQKSPTWTETGINWIDPEQQSQRSGNNAMVKNCVLSLTWKGVLANGLFTFMLAS